MSDRDLRELERQANAGDPRALARLQYARARLHGPATPCGHRWAKVVSDDEIPGDPLRHVEPAARDRIEFTSKVWSCDDCRRFFVRVEGGDRAGPVRVGQQLEIAHEDLAYARDPRMISDHVEQLGERVAFLLGHPDRTERDAQEHLRWLCQRRELERAHRPWATNDAAELLQIQEAIDQLTRHMADRRALVSPSDYLVIPADGDGP